MATRIICDHCGNMIARNPNVFSFGPFREALNQAYHSNAGRTQQQALQTLQAQANQTMRSAVAIKDIDLCNVCVPIWMQRVTNITKASDPE